MKKIFLEAKFESENQIFSIMLCFRIKEINDSNEISFLEISNSLSIIQICFER